MKRILVTGSEGFIGSHLCTALREQGYTVYAVDRKNNFDLCDKQIIKNLPEVDIVFHGAAFNGTKHFYTSPWNVATDNILPTQYLIGKYQGNCEHFIFTGSCESYAGAVDRFGYQVPTDERVPLVIDDVMNPRWSYGGSKLASEILCAAAYHQFGMPFTILRYHNIYGPGQVDHFIPEFVQRLKSGNTNLYGYDNTRSFFYIDDAINTTLKLLEVPVNGPVNIGSDQEVKILDMALLIKKYLSIEADLILHPAPNGSVSRRCPDISLLKSLISYQQTVDLSKGIKLTLDSLK